jgi:hypothetical protein
MAMTTASVKNEIELAPDAWERFERAVDVVSKSGPQHRKSKKSDVPTSFIEALHQLAQLIGERISASDSIDIFPKIINRLDKCLVVEPACFAASIARDVDCILQPSDLFLRLMAAVRARDVPLIRIIEHELTS